MSYGCIPMLTNQTRSLQLSDLGSSGEHETSFGPASCRENFFLGGGRLPVYAKMWEDCGTTKVLVGFMG